MSDFATVKIEDGIAIVSLNDGKANDFSIAILAQHNTCFDEAEPKADVIILTSAHPAMCPRLDL